MLLYFIDLDASGEKDYNDIETDDSISSTIDLRVILEFFISISTKRKTTIFHIIG